MERAGGVLRLRPRLAALDQSAAGLSDFGKDGFDGGYADNREPPGLAFIALKNMQNLRICHASMPLAFGRWPVLGCRRVLKSAES
ncbi:hypothetical protein CQ13_06740 [Bradyrhizobium retamae]|uniref:Uncharacterized protein n=1 Tax=Bradyrhizobium retamae TaxID=1300035 RepID=A0A0R3MPW4_9BRAD|nr:hypothetical protein CQ13_06740 [Bradyrhizobium retamae]